MRSLTHELPACPFDGADYANAGHNGKFEGIQKAMDTARSQQETPSGTLRINAFATAAREIMVPLILGYMERYPQVHIDLVTEGRLVDVVAAGFDLGHRGRFYRLNNKRRVLVATDLPRDRGEMGLFRRSRMSR
ncbi:LysR substrate binding domain-containing protein [Sphingobium sp. AP50]|nr:LysR substrate binding domain-containing protein [Sphingobium sp. AP50]